MFNYLFTNIDVDVTRKHCKTDVNHSLFPKIESKACIVNVTLNLFIFFETEDDITARRILLVVGYILIKRRLILNLINDFRNIYAL